MDNTNEFSFAVLKWTFAVQTIDVQNLGWNVDEIADERVLLY